MSSQEEWEAEQDREAYLEHARIERIMRRLDQMRREGFTEEAAWRWVDKR
jgi:PHD/YefM family antitoxin component YafN of YafNO toxin-antitoxin module